MKTRKNSKTDRESQRALARKGGVKTGHPTNPPDSKSDCLIIGGKTYTLPAELIQEIAAKLQPSAPETFEDCCAKFKKAWFPDTGRPGEVCDHGVRNHLLEGAAVSSEHRARQLAAIAKMITVADALNSGFDPQLQNMKYRIGFNICQGAYVECQNQNNGNVWFQSERQCEKAIKILGEDVIKTAFGL